MGIVGPSGVGPSAMRTPISEVCWTTVKERSRVDADGGENGAVQNQPATWT